MTSDHLVTLLNGIEIGLVTRGKNGALTFTYNEDWRQRRDAYPLSLSMPLAASQHAHEKIDAFIWGLLPDNENILARWAQRFHVSPRNAFSLISHVGEDCAGAVQFATPERLEILSNTQPEIEWLTEGDVGSRLSNLRMDQGASRLPRDAGQFSLAGAQAKTALLHENGKWGVPSGRTPTTHILKPPSAEFDGHAENEHFCLALIRAMNLPAADSQVKRFGNEIAIVVKRYDRIETAGGLVRIHQEDCCQAMGLPPTIKYQNEGGPSPEAIVGLLEVHSTEAQQDITTFIDALVCNWLIAGTDAHAKNYSLLFGANGNIRLAPLYDIASALPYDNIDHQRAKLAMKIGDEYRLRDIGIRQWRKFASSIKHDEVEIVEQVRNLVSRMPEQLELTRERVAREGLTHPVLDRLVHSVDDRTNYCRKLMQM